MNRLTNEPKAIGCTPLWMRVTGQPASDQLPAGPRILLKPIVAFEGKQRRMAQEDQAGSRSNSCVCVRVLGAGDVAVGGKRWMVKRVMKM